LTPTLRNCGSNIRKSYFWPVSQVIARFQHIGDESINNLTTKRVVCLSAIQNVSTSGEHQNDELSIEGFLTFLGGEYNTYSESLNVNEGDVASLPNLRDMRRKDFPPIRRNNWCINE